jgi:hypothetical protein
MAFRQTRDFGEVGEAGGRDMIMLLPLFLGNDLIRHYKINYVQINSFSFHHSIIYDANKFKRTLVITISGFEYHN